MIVIKKTILYNEARIVLRHSLLHGTASLSVSKQAQEIAAQAAKR